MNDEGHKKTDKILEELEKRVAEEYRIAQTEMQQKLKAYLNQYKIDVAKQRQLLKDGKITNQDYNDWVKRHIAMGKRWSDMRDVLAHDYHNANQIAMKMAYNTQKDVYAINRNYATYQIEHDAMIDTSYTLYDRDSVERILKDNPKLFHDPGTKKQREIARNKDLQWNKQKVNSAILQGILQGESIEKLAKRLESVTEKNYNAAVRNVRTAITGAQNAGRVDGYKRAQDMGIDLMQEWMATLDNRTRHEHRLLHGQRVKVGEPFIIDGHKLMYPGDPNGAGYLVYNCRCTLISQIKGFESARVEKSPKMGGLTFEQWQNEKAPRKPKETKKAEQVSFADKINNVRNKVNSNGGIITEDYLHEAGSALAEEVKAYRNPLKEEYDKIQKEYNEFKNSIKEQTTSLSEEIDKINEEIRQLITNGADIQTIKDKRKERDVIADKLDAIRYTKEEAELYSKLMDARIKYKGDAYSNSEWLKNKLSEIREMGSQGLNVKEHFNNSRSPSRKILEDGYSVYPKDWVIKSLAKSNMSVSKVQRGYYNSWTNEIALSGSTKTDLFETAIHELGHRMEYAVPKIMDSEKTFYERRTKGEELEWLGMGYSKSEKTRKDNFIDRYMGKDYGGNGYELVSMGFEYAYTDPEKLRLDPDMESWIYGILCLI